MPRRTEGFRVLLKPSNIRVTRAHLHKRLRCIASETASDFTGRVASGHPEIRKPAHSHATGLRHQVAHPCSSKPPQILFELLPRWNLSSGLPDSLEGQKATGDFGSFVRGRHETQPLLVPFARSSAMRLRETRGLDKTIPAAHHNSAKGTTSLYAYTSRFRNLRAGASSPVALATQNGLEPICSSFS